MLISVKSRWLFGIFCIVSLALYQVFVCNVYALTIDGNSVKHQDTDSRAMVGNVTLVPSKDNPSALVPTLMLSNPGATKSKSTEVDNAKNEMHDYDSAPFKPAADANSNSVLPIVRDNLTNIPQRKDRSQLPSGQVQDVLRMEKAFIPIPNVQHDHYSYGSGDALMSNKPTVRKVLLHKRSEVEELLRKGYKAFMKSDIENALQYYEMAMKKSPKNRMALFCTAVSYQMLLRHEEAALIYKKMIELGYNDVDVISNLTVAMGERDPVNAIKFLKDMENILPDHTLLLSQIGILYAKMREYDKAQRYLLMAIAKDKYNAMAAYNLAIVFDQMQLHRRALQYYVHTIDNVDKNGNALSIDVRQVKERIRALRLM